MSPTVVYIHGNGNKAAMEVLKQRWDLALFGQDMGTASRMAYFADVLYPAPLGGPEVDELEQVPAVPESAAVGGVDPAGLVAESLAEVRAGAGDGSGPETGPAEDPDAARLRGWLQEMAYVADAVVEGEDEVGSPPLPAAGPVAEATPLLGAAPVAEALPLPRAARIAAFRALVKVTFKDVYAYFFGGFKDRIRAALRDTLADTSGPVVVIAHSLGTIIAYDVLREAEQGGREIPLLVTAGSPLGTTEVQDLVVQRLQVPDGVAAWRNVADGRDLVALDRTIRPEYDPANRCTDFLVVNDSANHHGIREYLASRPIQESVRPLFA